MVKFTDSAVLLEAAREAFYACVRTSKLPLTVEDAVRVKEGPLKGKSGVPITIESVVPEPTYLIELEAPGGDAVLPLSILERITPEEPIQSPVPTRGNGT